MNIVIITNVIINLYDKNGSYINAFIDFVGRSHNINNKDIESDNKNI